MRLAFLLITAGILNAHDVVTTKITWSQEISRIVFKRCVSCHAPGGSAPMPLTTYAEARPWAKAIKEEVLNRSMPPWGAVKGFGAFRHDPSMTQEEILRIAEWVEGGAPEGDPIYAPPLPVRTPEPPAPAGKRVSKLVGPVKLMGIRPLQSIPSTRVVAHLPDGSSVPLLWLRNYNEHWKRTFVYREPVELPKGTTITAEPEAPLEFIVRR